MEIIIDAMSGFTTRMVNYDCGMTSILNAQGFEFKKCWVKYTMLVS